MTDDEIKGGLEQLIENLMEARNTRLRAQLRIAEEALTHIAKNDCAEPARVADDALTRMSVVE